MAEKLVRDNIPELIRFMGDSPRYRRAKKAERPKLLMAKLAEECAEAQVAFDDWMVRSDDREVRGTWSGALAEELADVLEVVHALGREIGLGHGELETLRAERTGLRGGFAMGIALELDEPRGGGA